MDDDRLRRNGIWLPWAAFGAAFAAIVSLVGIAVSVGIWTGTTTTHMLEFSQQHDTINRNLNEVQSRLEAIEKIEAKDTEHTLNQDARLDKLERHK